MRGASGFLLHQQCTIPSSVHRKYRHACTRFQRRACTSYILGSAATVNERWAPSRFSESQDRACFGALLEFACRSGSDGKQKDKHFSCPVHCTAHVRSETRRGPPSPRKRSPHRPRTAAGPRDSRARRAARQTARCASSLRPEALAATSFRRSPSPTPSAESLAAGRAKSSSSPTPDRLPPQSPALRHSSTHSRPPLPPRPTR